MRLSKRTLDVVLAGVGVVLLLPVALVIAVLVRREDGGSIFYRPQRVGYRGRPFRLWKFRTMRVDADREGVGLTVGDDPRVTRIGKTLRRYKLDELPQLLNVLAGEMSLVGPRPEDPRYVARYTQDQRRVLDLMPGITDPASIVYADESQTLAASQDVVSEYIDRIMPDKIRLNLEYAAGASTGRDIVVILRTLVRVFRG